jgi:hypothetical protein
MYMIHEGAKKERKKTQMQLPYAGRTPRTSLLSSTHWVVGLPSIAQSAIAFLLALFLHRTKESKTPGIPFLHQPLSW